MSNLFQSPEWEEFKLKTGYDKSFRINDILILQKKLPFGASMLYAPMVRERQLQQMLVPVDIKIGLKSFFQQIRMIAQKNNSIFFRLEFNFPTASANSDYLVKNFRFIRAFEEMQPEHTWVLNLNKPETEFMAEMKPKCRYNIKIAIKNNVFVTKSDRGGIELDNFYAMYKKTGQRHSISYRSKNYFEALLKFWAREAMLVFTRPRLKSVIKNCHWPPPLLFIRISGRSIFLARRAIITKI